MSKTRVHKGALIREDGTRFAMGDLVVVEAVYKRDQRTIRKHEERIVATIVPRRGWVAGFRYVPLKWVAHWDEEYFRYDHYEATQRDWTILVCFWPTQRPVEVPPYRLHHANSLAGDPTMPECVPGLGAYMRDEMRQAPYDFPRDEKGRFVRVWRRAEPGEKCPCCERVAPYVRECPMSPGTWVCALCHHGAASGDECACDERETS